MLTEEDANRIRTKCHNISVRRQYEAAMELTGKRVFKIERRGDDDSHLLDNFELRDLIERAPVDHEGYIVLDSYSGSSHNWSGSYMSDH